MRRIPIQALALTLALLLLGALPAAAQSLPSKKEMTSSVERACRQLSLAGEGSPPFHLVARLHYEGNAGPVDGVYELLWASRGRFREVFRLGPIAEVTVALDTKRYIARNTPFASSEQLGFASLMNLPVAVSPRTGREVKKVYQWMVGSSLLPCADVEDVYQNRRICVDPETGEMAFDGFNASSVDGRVTFEASDFITLDTARFPRRLVKKGAHETLEVTVDVLRRASRFADDVFSPPTGAKEYDWCPHPVIHPTELLPPENVLRELHARIESEGSYRPGPPAPAQWAYSLIISADGRVEQSVPLYGVDRVIDAAFEHYFKTQRFPTRTCGDKPIGYEMNFQLDVNALDRGSYLF